MPGIIMGAMGGAGDALVKFGLEEQRSVNDQALENLRSANTQNRAIALEKAKLEIGQQATDKARTDMLARREAAKNGIVESAVSERFADAKPANPATWTPEQQAAVDQAKGIERSKMGKDKRVYIEAGYQTGELTPKDLVGIMARDDANEVKFQIAELRTEALNARTQAQYEVGMAKLESAISKAAGGKDQGNKEMLSLLDGMRKDIASEASNLKATYAAETKDRSRIQISEIDAAYKPKFAAIEKRRKQIQSDFNVLRSKVGLPAIGDDTEDTPTPAQAPANRPPLSSFQK